MSYTNEDLRRLASEYRSTLVDEVVPFWLPRAVDEEHGGYLIARDRDGSLVDDDKSVWQQGRFASQQPLWKGYPVCTAPPM